MQAGAVILAGGKSSRMGQNKALLPIDGEANIARITNCLKEAFHDVLIVANNNELYEFLNIPIVNDKVEGKGPLAGIQAGLLAAKHDANVFVACDMPFISINLAKAFIEKSEGFDAVVPIIGGKQHPLFAVYKKSLLSVIDQCLQTDQLRLKHVLDQANVNYVREEDLPIKEIDKLHKVFYNMNHPSEYEEAKKMAKN